MEKTKLQWHPAFGAALRITLQDEISGDARRISAE